jgi:hypothetical protein
MKHSCCVITFDVSFYNDFLGICTHAARVFFIFYSIYSYDLFYYLTAMKHSSCGLFWRIHASSVECYLRKHWKSLSIRHSEWRRAYEPKRRIQRNNLHSLDSSIAGQRGTASFTTFSTQNDNIRKLWVIQRFLEWYAHMIRMLLLFTNLFLWQQHVKNGDYPFVADDKLDF